MKPRTIEAVQRALEKAGVEFTNGDKPGVRVNSSEPGATASIALPGLRCAQSGLHADFFGALESSPQFENLRIVRTLAEKVRIMAAQSQFRAGSANKPAGKIIDGSEGWLAAAESFEFGSCDELKKLRLAHQGRQPVTY